MYLQACSIHENSKLGLMQHRVHNHKLGGCLNDIGMHKDGTAPACSSDATCGSLSPPTPFSSRAQVCVLQQVALE